MWPIFIWGQFSGHEKSTLNFPPVLLDGGAVDGVLDEEVGVRQRLDLLVVVEVGQDPNTELLILALYGAGEGLLDGGVHVGPG